MRKQGTSLEKEIMQGTMPGEVELSLLQLEENPVGDVEPMQLQFNLRIGLILLTINAFVHSVYLLTYLLIVQFFDAVGWASGRASGL